jgi:alpha-L-rhamnosidase
MLPTRVVWSTVNATNPTALLNPVTDQIYLGGDSMSTSGCRMQGYNASVLLDFGVEVSGGVQIGIPTASQTPLQLRVRFGESVGEAMSELHTSQDSTNDHAIRDELILAPNMGTQEIGNTAFRFVRIDFVGLSKSDDFAVVQFVKAIFKRRDLKQIGMFYSSDDTLNKIWNVGAYTVHLNMQNYLWDGAKRDRLVWIGDMHPETSTVSVVFGNHSVVTKSLNFAKQHTPLPGWMNGISSYSLWWILIQHDWYMHSGDMDFLKQQETYLVNLLTQVSTCVKSDGTENLPGMRFLDGPSSDNTPAVHAGLQALTIISLKSGVQLLQFLGKEHTDLIQKIDGIVEQMLKVVPDPNNNKQAAALMVLAGLADAKTTNEKILAVDGAHRLSTFLGYYVLQARAEAGDINGSLDVIRDYWGGMLDYGATTFWEDFNLDWVANNISSPIDQLTENGKKDLHGDFGAYCYIGYRKSLCHGWASGPTAWLSKYVLGVNIVEPGCKVLKIEPQLGDLSWVEGVFPTPYGPVKLYNERDVETGKVSTKVLEAPKEIKIIIQ